MAVKNTFEKLGLSELVSYQIIQSINFCLNGPVNLENLVFEVLKMPSIPQ